LGTRDCAEERCYLFLIQFKLSLRSLGYTGRTVLQDLVRLELGDCRPRPSGVLAQPGAEMLQQTADRLDRALRQQQQVATEVELNLAQLRLCLVLGVVVRGRMFRDRFVELDDPFEQFVSLVLASLRSMLTRLSINFTSLDWSIAACSARPKLR
jgi:hypothetical protein